MNFNRALLFVFEDPDWLKKAGIAALVFLIPVLGQILLMGWGLEITRRIIAQEPVPLPGWDDFSAYITKGFYAFLVTLVYSLPATLFVIFLVIASVGSAAAPVKNDSTSTTAFVTITLLCLSCLVFLFLILAGLIIPPATANLAVKGELGAAFRLKEVLDLFRASPGSFILVLLAIGLANLVLAPLGVLLCGIGTIITTTYTTALGSHLTGQAYQSARAAQAAKQM